MPDSPTVNQPDKSGTSSDSTGLGESGISEAATTAESAAAVFGLPNLRDATGRQGGDVGGLGTGGSVDFHDHRAYQLGDDVRHINWQAYGRTGSYTMKLFREEVQPLVDVVLDLSSSMFFEPEKARRTAELIVFSCHAAARSQASVRLFATDGDGASSIRPLTRDDVFTGSWAEWVAPPGSGKEATGLDLSGIPFRRGSVRILIGDLLHKSAPESTLLPFANGAGMSLVWAPFSQSEAEPDWTDNCELEDAETVQRLPIWADSAMLKRYRDAYSRHFDLWTAQARQLGVRVARIPAEGELTDALMLVAGENTAIQMNR